MNNPSNDSAPQMPNPQAESPKHDKKPAIKRLQRVLLVILCVILAICLILVSTYFVLYHMGKKSLQQTPTVTPPPAVGEVEDDGLTLIYQGRKYRYNENIVSILFMGVDKKDLDKNHGYGENGQADTLFLACLDTESGAVKILPIARESMVEVDEISEDGNSAGIVLQQICLAYAYGATAEESAENVSLSVQRLLYGIAPSATAVLDLSGIRKLSDLVGSITVTCNENVSSHGYYFKEGKQYTLKGNKLHAYLRARNDDVDASNRRMIRQKEVLRALVTAAAAKLTQDPTAIVSMYNTMQPYTETSLSLAEITYLASCCVTADLGSRFEYVSVQGTTQRGEEFVEFYPDETSLYESVLSLFYTPEE